jgi:type I restriction enzyme R subunit
VPNWRRSRGAQKLPHLSFFALRPPKDKKWNCSHAGQAVKKAYVFHQITMRQANAEEFILDVLQSYTTYKTYFELLQNEKAEGASVEFERRGDFCWNMWTARVRHPRNAHIIVDHSRARRRRNRSAGHCDGGHALRAHAVLEKQAD